MKYPGFVKSPEDRKAYDKARRGRWHKWVRNASDILAIKGGCDFDLARAKRVEQFFLLLRHSKGRWAGQPFELQPWQRDGIIYPLFGYIRSDGTRRFRKGFVFIPKKAGKSTLGAAISLYLLVADGEAGAEVYNAAADRSNTMNVYGEAASMVRKSPALSRRLRIYDGIKRIQFSQTDSFYQALSSDAASAEGKNIHGLVFDELHTIDSRDLWRALQGGGVSRTQPLFLAITTAGTDTESLCFQEYKYAKGVIAGTIPDWSYFGFVAEADPKDDPGDPETWAKSNPGLGVSPTVQALADLWKKAKDSPEDRNDFLQYHLNLWVQAAESAIPLHVWDKGNTPFDPEELLGRECYAAFDGGFVSDLSALVLLFPQEDGSFRVRSHFWCPEDRSRDRGEKKVSYLKWMEEGHITATEGNAADYDRIRADIYSILGRYQCKSLAVDPFGTEDFMMKLEQEGLPVARFPARELIQPSRRFMELLLDGKIHHGGNPVLRWMAGNLVMKRDSFGNYWPDKQKSHEKVDGVVATIMALGSFLKLGPEHGESHYAHNDLLVLRRGESGRAKLQASDSPLEAVNENNPQVRHPHAVKRLQRVTIPAGPLPVR